MAFDPSSAKVVSDTAFEYSFDPNTAKEDTTFDASSAQEVTTPKQEVPNATELGTIESTARGAKSGFGKLSQAAGAPFVGVASLVDKVASAITGKPVTSAVDTAASLLMEPGQKIQDASALKENEKFSGLAPEVAYKTMSNLGDLAGGLTQGGPALVNQIPARTLAPTIKLTAEHLVSQYGPSVAAAVPMATTAIENTYRDLTSKGVVEGKVVPIALLEGMKMLLFGATPLSLEGKVLSRAVQGGVSAVTQIKAGEEAKNMILGEYDANAQTKMNTADYLSTALTGSIAATIAGRNAKPGEETPAQKTQKAYDDIVNDLDAIKKEQQQDVNTDNIKSPYMKPKTYKEAQEYADATNEPGNRLLTPTISSKKPYWPVGTDDAAMATAMQEANNNADMALYKAVTSTNAGDIIASDIKQNDLGLAIKDIDNASEPPLPAIPPDVNATRVDGLSKEFLNAVSKKQGGHIDLGAYTGTGFRDVVEGLRRASSRLWSIVPEAYKGNFQDAYVKNPDGSPVILAHGTTKQFNNYDPKYGDGGLTHFGTVDSATIINDRNIKSDYNYQTNNGEKVHFPPFVDFLLDYYKGDVNKVNSAKDSEIAAIRDEWYANKTKLVDQTTNKEISSVTKEFDSIISTLSRLNEDQQRAKVISILNREHPKDKLTESALNYLTDGPRLMEQLDKNKNLVPYLRALKERIGDVVSRYVNSASGQHLRPLWTSIKNPIHFNDMGVWGDTIKLLNDLLDQKALSLTKEYTPLPFLEQLAQQKGADYANNVKSQLGDLLIETKSTTTGLPTSAVYKILEDAGFDGFMYQNKAESISFKDSVESNNTVFSLATWKPELIHDLVDVPRIPRGQQGSLNIGEIAKGLDEIAKKVSRLIKLPVSSITDKYYRPINISAKVFNTPEEVLSHHTPVDTPDLPSYGKNILTTNQTKLVMDHPWFNFVWDKIGQTKREANTRFSLYADALQDVFKLRRADQLTLFKKLGDLQDPELKEGRRMAEATSTREQFLLEQGLPPKLVPHAVRVLDVLKHAFIKDNESTARVGRDPFDLEPMYFPRAHTGKYNVVIRTAENDVKYATGFDSGVEAQIFVKNLRDSYKTQIESGDLAIDLHRNHYGKSSDIFSAMALEHGIPESIKAIAAGIEKNIEIAKQKFELHRANEGVLGYVGERLGNEETFRGRYDNDKLLNLLQNRLRASHDWEVRSKLIDSIKAPFFDDITIAHDKPMFRSFVGQIINRELGHDIGVNFLGGTFRALQKVVEDGSKAIDKYYFGRKHGYEGGDLALVSPKAIEETAQMWTYITSFMKLAVNPPILAANATAIPLVFTDGMRTASKEKMGMHNAIAAYYDTLMYAGFENKGATKFMQEAMKEGMIEPHISETYDLAETSSHQSANKADVALNSARNQIEKGTNFTAILYYYNYYNRVAPYLHGEALKRIVYSKARSYTGDYSLEAGPLMFSQASTVGRLMTNFSKWKWNQVGRLVDDIKDAKNGNALPLVVNIATQVLVGGIYGTAGIVDYEAIRRLGKVTKMWDWQPFVGYFDAAQDTMKKEFNIDPNTTEWIRRGPMNTLAEKSFYALGLPASPDISGSMRHSSALEAPTVAFTQFKDLFIDALPAGVKKLWQSAGGKTTGFTVEDREKVIQGLPSVLQGPVKHIVNVQEKFGTPEASVAGATKFMKQLQRPGEIISHSKFNETGIYRRSEAEERLSILNMHSAKENNYTDKLYYNSWLKQNRATQIADRVKGIINNADNPDLFKDNINDLAVLGGPQTIKNIIKQMQTNEINKNLTAEDQAAITVLHTLDPIRKQFMLEQMNRFVKSNNTSTTQPPASTNPSHK